MSSTLLVYAPDFYRRAARFAARHLRYQQPDGSTNIYRIMNAVKACGYDEVNAENIEQVMTALEARAEAYEAKEKV